MTKHHINVNESLVPKQSDSKSFPGSHNVCACVSVCVYVHEHRDAHNADENQLYRIKLGKTKTISVTSYSHLLCAVARFMFFSFVYL